MNIIEEYMLELFNSHSISARKIELMDITRTGKDTVRLMFNIDGKRAHFTVKGNCLYLGVIEQRELPKEVIDTVIDYAGFNNAKSYLEEKLGIVPAHNIILTAYGNHTIEIDGSRVSIIHGKDIKDVIIKQPDGSFVVTTGLDNLISIDVAKDSPIYAVTEAMYRVAVENSIGKEGKFGYSPYYALAQLPIKDIKDIIVFEDDLIYLYDGNAKRIVLDPTKFSIANARTAAVLFREVVK